MTATAVTPVGPRGNRVLGNGPEFTRDPLSFFTRCAREYGDIVPLRFLHRRVVLFNDPAHVAQILGPEYRKFFKTGSLRTPVVRLLFGNGLVTSEGEFWARQRRLAQPAFHRERIAAYGQVMVEYGERMLAGWAAGQTRDVHEDMMRLTLEIAAQTLFSAEVADDADEAGAALRILMEQFTTQWSPFALLDGLLPTPNYRRFQRSARRLDAIVYRIIQQRRATGQDTGDLLSLLLHAQDEDGSRMTDLQLRDEAVTFFFAGHETTALALSWAWYLLAQYPEVEARLADELRAVLDGRAPTVADLPRLVYTERVVRETMRLYPPVWSMGRQVVEPVAIGGYPLVPGLEVVLSQWVVHRDRRWYPDPEAFDPDRWADEPPRGAYFPFGLGPRGCIGQQFAAMEAILLLATIAQRYHLALLPDPPVEPWVTMTLRPRHGLRMLLDPR